MKTPIPFLLLLFSCAAASDDPPADAPAADPPATEAPPTAEPPTAEGSPTAEPPTAEGSPTAEPKATILLSASGNSEGAGMYLRSSAFEADGEIPRRYTCQGHDVSPGLSWGEFPEGTQSVALVVDDPDAPDPAAPKMTWVHWVLYDIPPTAKGLPESVTSAGLPTGTRQGTNDWKRTGWGGPCPPIGRHRYFFKLYALDAVLGDLGQPTKAQLEAAMEGHVLQKVEIVGTYQKSG